MKDELGTGLAAQIKAEHPANPILLISGAADTLADADGTERVDGIIQKDAGPTNLLVCVARALKL